MNKKLNVLISSEDLQKRIKELATQINNDYKGEKITLVCVLKGGVMFFTDLAKHLTIDVEFDFLDVSSYGNEQVSSGIVKVNKDLDSPVTGKKVIVVEDIIDTGHSLVRIKEHLLSQQPADLKIAVLLDKPERREAKIQQPEYIGFTIPNKFVVGFGLDDGQLLRNLDYVGYVTFEE